MIHLYCGDGKGKTTAAMGLALRAVGHGQNVCIVQFLKDATSGEIAALKTFKQVTVLACDPDITFTFRMNDRQRKTALQQHNSCARQALEQVKSGAVQMLVLDEACAALKSGLVDEELLKELVLYGHNDQLDVEAVITGRNPASWMVDMADYISEIRCVRHPYDKGIEAREGIEY